MSTSTNKTQPTTSSKKATVSNTPTKTQPDRRARR